MGPPSMTSPLFGREIKQSDDQVSLSNNRPGAGKKKFVLSLINIPQSEHQRPRRPSAIGKLSESGSSSRGPVFTTEDFKLIQTVKLDRNQFVSDSPNESPEGKVGNFLDQSKSSSSPINLKNSDGTAYFKKKAQINVSSVSDEEFNFQPEEIVGDFGKN